MAEDIHLAVAAGLPGIVIGATQPDGTLDAGLLSRLIEGAREAAARRGTHVSLTLHRAFDTCHDLPAALEDAIRLGFDRVLTSGGAVSAMAGRSVLGALVRQARGRIQILAGSGIDVGNVRAILDAGVDEIHASCGAVVDNPDARLVELGFCGPKLKYTDASRVSALAAAMQDWERRAERSVGTPPP